MDRGAFLVTVHRVTKSWTGQVTKQAHNINFYQRGTWFSQKQHETAYTLVSLRLESQT